MPRKQPKKNDTSTILAGTTPLSHDNNLIVADENCKPVSDEITALIDAISRDHQACTIASKSAIKHAIEAGQKIRAVRAFAGHGNWEDYFIKHIAWKWQPKREPARQPKREFWQSEREPLGASKFSF